MKMSVRSCLAYGQCLQSYAAFASGNTQHQNSLRVIFLLTSSVKAWWIFHISGNLNTNALYKLTENFLFQALGNHEFDEGLPTLQNFISNITDGDGKFDVLSSNIDNSNEQGLTGYLPWVIKEIGGKKIGIIGYTTKDTVTLTAPGKQFVFVEV